MSPRKGGYNHDIEPVTGLPRDENKRLEAVRQFNHSRATKAELAQDKRTQQQQVQDWLDDLKRLDATTSNAETLEVCRDLLLHAPEDFMLNSDARIIKAAMQQLEEDLERQPISCSPYRRNVHGSAAGGLDRPRFEDDDPADCNDFDA